MRFFFWGIFFEYVKMWIKHIIFEYTEKKWFKGFSSSVYIILYINNTLHSFLSFFFCNFFFFFLKKCIYYTDCDLTARENDKMLKKMSLNILNINFKPYRNFYFLGWDGEMVLWCEDWRGNKNDKMLFCIVDKVIYF